MRPRRKFREGGKRLVSLGQSGRFVTYYPVCEYEFDAGARFGNVGGTPHGSHSAELPAGQGNQSQLTE
jgi:hypothetical protein